MSTQLIVSTIASRRLPQRACSYESLGSGPGQFHSLYSVAVDSSDMIYVSDYRNHRVCVFSPEEKFLESFGSKGEAQGQFKQPRMVHVDENDLILVSDYEN